jgi:hypothetical protein
MDEQPALGARVWIRVKPDEYPGWAELDGVRGTVVRINHDLSGSVGVLPETEWIIGHPQCHIPIDLGPDVLEPDHAVTDTRNAVECENCGQAFKARAGARYCSGACRVAAHRLRAAG